MDTNTLKKHLKKVILKADFLAPVLSFNGNLPHELNEVIKKTFPIADPRSVPLQEIQMSVSQQQHSIAQKSSTIREWNYYSRDRKKLFTVTQESFLFVYDKYESFEDLKKDFIPIASLLFELNKDMAIKRIGLRYINNVEDNKKTTSIFEWDGVLNKKLLAGTTIPNKKEKQKLSRAFQVLEFSYDDFSLRFQYGMHNPDYPSIIKQKQFTLDFDAYYNGMLTKEKECEERLIIFHDAIKKMVSRC